MVSFSPLIPDLIVLLRTKHYYSYMSLRLILGSLLKLLGADGSQPLSVLGPLLIETFNKNTPVQQQDPEFFSMGCVCILLLHNI